MKYCDRLFLLGLLSLCVASLSAVATAAPPFRTPAKLFDRESHTLGLKVLAGQHRLLFRATETSYQYCHHPNLVVFRDKLFCMWSNGVIEEDMPGQRILYWHGGSGN